MPFTLSHAVVAIPFTRGVLPAGAVAVGAMIPDAPLFVSGGHGYDGTHGFPGILGVDLPLALLVYVAWRILLRPVLRGVLPRMVAERIPPEWSTSPGGGWRSIWQERGRPVAASVALLLAALLIGILSHVLWDAFTHVGRWGSELVPALATEVAGFTVARWLQYLSSAFGLLWLALYGVLWWRRRPIVPVTRPAHPLVVVGFWMLVAVTAGLVALGALRVVLAA